MAISSKQRVQRIEVYPLSDETAADTANAKHPTVMVCYENVLTGTGTDAHLDGTVANENKHLSKFVEDGGAATDYSKEDALVKTVCAAIWA
tara:strand:+ start:130 stop:402 length:273 start_codon:yes stop_codon:yes gene_type:complete